MALRSLPAGAGFKPPRAALAEDRCRKHRGKSRACWTRQVRIEKASTSEPPFRRRKQLRRHQNQRTQSSLGRVHRKPAYWVGDVRRKGGVSSIQARPWNCGNPSFDAKGDGQVKKSETQSTDARFGGGPTCSSVDTAVMAVERRGRVALVDARANFLGSMSP